MLESILGFSGRLNRLQYFLSALAVGGLTLVASVVVIVAFVPHPATKPDLGPALLLLAPIGLGYLWATLSMQACRVRDIGWNPVFVLPAVVLAMVLLQGLSHAAPPLHLLSGLFNLGFGGVLLFWPGSSQDGAGPARRDGRPAPAPPPPSAPAPRPMTPAATARASFGQRGL